MYVILLFCRIKWPWFFLTFDQYGLFFASAGHASLIDYPDAKGLQSIAAKVYTNGGIVSAVYANLLL